MSISQNTLNRGWKKHLLRAKNDRGEPVKLIVFTRVEFQDVTHKEGTKRHEDSGRPHAHVLIFGEEMERLKLEEVWCRRPSLRPTSPCCAARSRARRQTRTRIQSGATYDGQDGWDEESSTLRLKHSEEDEDAGVLRSYFPDIMNGCPCHQDLQLSDGEALLMQYVTKYCSKFSDASYEEWIDDDGDANVVARRLCYEYHPYEPEMLLQLSGQLFKLWLGFT